MQHCPVGGQPPCPRRIVAVAAAALTLAGCTVGPDFHSPPPPAADHYTRGADPQATVAAPGQAGTAQTFDTGADIPAQWWTVFHSAPLDRLIRAALAHSPTIAAAQAALRAAQEGYNVERGTDVYPQLDAQLQGTREEVSGASFGIPSAPATAFTLFSAAVNVSYKFDLFGGVRRQLEALQAQAEYQRWELEAARLTLADNVVTTAVAAASLQDQVQATRDIIATEREQLGIVQRQFNAGAASHADVLTQQAQVAQLEATLPALTASYAQAGHRLAVLAGRPPEEGDPTPFVLAALQLPAQLPLSVPARLVRQRPDVRAAEALLHAASAQAGVATADLYPQLTLSGSIGSQTTSIGDLFSAGTAAWSIGGSLMQPLFHGGALRAQRREAFDDLDQAAAQYRSTVLSALQEVADTLRALQADALTLAAQVRAESAAQESLSITRLQYRLGATSYVNLLLAQRQYAQARQTRIQAQAARFTDSAALLQALGGGWWNRTTKGSDRAEQ